MRGHEDITYAVKTHSDTVLRICSVYFGSRPEREDAFQETFIKYSQSDKVFSDDEHAKAWLINVASNTCKDMLKRAEAKAVPTDQFDEAARPSWHAEETQPASERAAEIGEALKQLDYKYRITLYLKYYEGYTALQIAGMLDMEENTVYTNLARGRAKLKEVLTHDS